MHETPEATPAAASDGSDPYAEIPYTDHAYAESHPDRLAVVARLSGWAAPALERARILEIGCGVGGNVLAMAASLPSATLVGIDPSKRQIDDARRTASGAGLSNVTFHAAPAEEVELAPGSFDYVVLHGVYSWVSIDTRRALLRAIARWVAPDGVAYVSFNTLPGWYDRLAAKEWLRFTASASGLGLSLEETRASLAWLRDRASPELATYRRQIEGVIARLAETDRAYLVHEYLSPEHHPELVSTFLAETEGAGLRYLGDAIAASTSLELLDDDVCARVRSLDVTRTQQVVDFVKHTSFRRALLVRADTCDARGWRWPSSLEPDARVSESAMDTLHVASRLRASPDVPDQFDGNDGSVHVYDKAASCALLELARVAPRAVPFDDLCGRVAAAMGAPTADVRHVVRKELYDLWLATGGIDLHAYEPRIVTTASERPESSALARWHAVHGGTLTNLWHQEVVLAEDVVRFVLGLADGTRTLEAIAREVRDARALSEAEALDVTRASVDLLAKAALLIR